MKDARRRVAFAVAGLVIISAGLLLLSSCGGDDGPTQVTPTTTVATPPPPRTILTDGISLPVNFVVLHPFTVDRAGTLEATVDWTFGTSRIIVWIARGQCTFDQFEADQCTYVATSFAGAKPRRVSATGATSGPYTLIIYNDGPEDESIAYQVVLTPTAGTGSPGMASLSSGEPRVWGPTQLRSER